MLLVFDYQDETAVVSVVGNDLINNVRSLVPGHSIPFLICKTQIVGRLKSDLVCANMADDQRDDSDAEVVTQLDFQQAMSDFQTMFPSMEPAVIETVLRANHGAVDATIDQLLSMNTDYEVEKSRLESSSSSFTPPPSYNQAVNPASDESLIRLPTSH